MPSLLSWIIDNSTFDIFLEISYPKGAGWSLVSEPILNDYAFIYEYDECMRVVSKKLPGCEPVRFCYDRCGQLAFSQDGNQRDEGRRMFYLYDTAGRPTMTGLCDASSTWIVYTDTAMVSSRVDSPSIDKTYYSAPVAFGNPKMLNVWYYDTYPQLPGHSLDPNVTCPGLVAVSASALMPPRGDQDRLITVTYYDWDKRPAVVTTDIPGGGFVRTDTQFTLTDQVDSIWITTRMPGKPDIVDRYKYRYDHADRLKSVTYYHDGDAPVVLAVNDYDALGRLATAKLPGETVSYAYNVRNALTSIASPRFSQQLRYAAGAAAPCYNGNIAEAVTQGNRYAYTYDNANRLTSAKYTPSAGDADYSATYAYDRNSNITALTRKGLKDIFGNYGPVDDLTMLYDGNRLWRVSDHADEVLLENSGNLRNPEIFDPSETQFGYDANGNTVKDLSRNIEKMDYNTINLPLSARLVQGADRLTGRKTNQSISYTYDASGVRHRVIHATQPLLGTMPMRIATADTTDYVGNYVIRNGQIDKIMTPYGYLQDGKFHTFLHDYQGNVAAVVVGDSVTQRNSYYPYGLPHVTSLIKLQSPSATSVTDNPYKYGGKEFDTFGGTDLYDFHARYHAPSTGRFMTVDPMAEKYPGISPYMYCAGNPIFYTDPTWEDLVIEGFIKNLQIAIMFLQKGMGDFFDVNIDENGLVSLIQRNDTDLANMTQNQQNYYHSLNQIITDNAVTTITASENIGQPIGDVNTATIDTEDLSAIGDGEFINGSSAILHELWEQYQIQTKGKSPEKAHNEAANREFFVTGTYPHATDRFLNLGVMAIPIYKNTTPGAEKIGTVYLRINHDKNIIKITRWKK